MQKKKKKIVAYEGEQIMTEQFFWMLLFFQNTIYSLWNDDICWALGI